MPLPPLPPNLGRQVTTRNFSLLEMVSREWGSSFKAPDHRIYEWSNGRGFDSTDIGYTGIYGPPVYTPAYTPPPPSGNPTVDSTTVTVDSTLYTVDTV